MTALRITAALLDDRDRALLGDAVISQTGAIAVADIDDADLPDLMDAGLALLTAEPIAVVVEPTLTDLQLAPPPMRADPPTVITAPIGSSRGSFDIAAGGGPTVGARSSDIHIVAFDRPVGSQRRDDMIVRGWRPLERLGPLTSTVRVDAARVDVSDILEITGERRYDTLDTVNPDLLRSDLTPSDVIAEAFLHPWREEAPDQRAVNLAAWLSGHGVDVLGHSESKVRFPAIRGDTLLWSVSSMPEVRWVDEYVRPTLANDHARRLVGIDAATRPSAPWTGAGQTVGVADSSIDSTHPDFAGRIDAVLQGTPNAQTTDSPGHGTHVAGSVAGAGETVRGMAPQSRLVIQSLLQPDGTIDVPIDLGRLFDQAKAAGVHIHNNSWGIKARSVYRETSRELDTWAFSNPDMLIVVAAGNDATAAHNPRTPPGYVDLFSTNAPGTAKNALTVGACRTDRVITPTQTWRDYARRTRTPSVFADDPIGSDTVAGDPQRLAAFSGRGPCDEENRLKPDLVAPGTYILSARSSHAPDSAFWQLDDDPNYAYLGGSSMATGVVSGLAAIVRQYYTDERGHTPSAALLKATLINGARWLGGDDAIANHPLAPNCHQGFGCVDLAGSLPLPGEPNSPKNLVFADTCHDDDRKFTDYGQTRDYTFRFGTGPLRICLVWTDPPGRNVQFPISLVVQQHAQRWSGNSDRPNNMYKTQLDTNNNVQIVRLEQAPAGIYQIRLTASADVDTDNGPQSFALVCTGDITSDLRPQ